MVLAARVSCYSALLIVPFLRVLQQRGLPVPLGGDGGQGIDPDLRIPIPVAEQQLLTAIAVTGDANLGLVAGRSMITGDCAALDYVISTAANVRDAIEVAARYARLANDALQLDLEVGAERALLHVASSVPLQRASHDFMLAGLFASQVRHWPYEDAQLECLFQYERPDDIAAHEQAFPGAALRFGAPGYGFAFACSLLERRPRGADPRLHAVTRDYAKRLLTDLPAPVQTHRETVKKLLPGELAQARTDARNIARKLGLSVRTLGRRLEEEGTSYKELVEEVRRELAFSYLGNRDVAIPEVALLLGFSDVTAFHRAFRRWSKMTPGAYRAARRAQR